MIQKQSYRTQCQWDCLPITEAYICKLRACHCQLFVFSTELQSGIDIYWIIKITEVGVFISSGCQMFVISLRGNGNDGVERTSLATRLGKLGRSIQMFANSYFLSNCMWLPYLTINRCGIKRRILRLHSKVDWLMHSEYNAKIKIYKMATEIFYYRTRKLEQRNI